MSKCTVELDLDEVIALKSAISWYAKPEMMADDVKSETVEKVFDKLNLASGHRFDWEDEEIRGN